MPIEVICLSSSPLAPTPPRPKKQEPSAPRPRAPSRVLNYDNDNSIDLTGMTPARKTQKASAPVSKKPIAGTTRTSVGQRRQNDHDFLFLSDDFDTTGDLDGGASKSTKGSPASHNNGRSMTRTSSATLPATKNCNGPLRAAGLKRWNTIADPIEYSSSPRDGPSNENLMATSRDKKASGKQVHQAPARESAKDPFASSSPEPLAKTMAGKGIDFIDLSSPPRAQPVKRKVTAAWDPISSSMPDLNTSRECDDFASSPPAQSSKRRADAIELDNSDSDDGLPDLGDIDFSKSLDRMRSKSSSPHKRAKTMQSKKKAPKSDLEKELEKGRKAQAREEEKERKRVEKERAKEQNALERERQKALAEVNKVRTDKKVFAPEMIVDIASSLAPGVSVQVQTLLDGLQVQHESWHSPVDNVIGWRRKVSSRFNEELGHWEPVNMRIKSEKHVLVVIPAPEFVKLALGVEGVDLEAHYLKMTTHFPNNTIIYLIEGLTPWLRKNRNNRNRQFQSAVRGDAAPASSQSRRRQTAPQEYIDEDMVEDALLALQVQGVLIHHTNAPVETAQWITIFTQHISTIPYRKARDAVNDSAGFCMEAGQVRTGDGPKDTYIRMLQEITRVTAPMAYGIAETYPTVTELVKGFEQNGPLALENCRKSANRDGALTDRTVGQAVSKRLYKIFTGRDPDSTDV